MSTNNTNTFTNSTNSNSNAGTRIILRLDLANGIIHSPIYLPNSITRHATPITGQLPTPPPSPHTPLPPVYSYSAAPFTPAPPAPPPSPAWSASPELGMVNMDTRPNAATINISLSPSTSTNTSASASASSKAITISPVAEENNKLTGGYFLRQRPNPRISYN